MALECSADQMIDMLDEHLPYEVFKMLVCHDNLYPVVKVADTFSSNVLIEGFCLHARNLFEFLTKKDGGGKNDGFAKAYAPNFEAFRERQTADDKNDLYKKICAQITHLSFNRLKGEGKVRTDVEVPATKILLLPEITAFAHALERNEYRRAWERGVVKFGLSRWGF